MSLNTVDSVPDVDFRTTETELAALRSDLHSFVEDSVDDADADGLVVCMSGGIDSTLTAHLAAGALGPDRVTALVLPCHLTDSANAIDAQGVAEDIGLDPTVIQVQPLLDMFEDTIAPAVSESTDRTAIGNAVARLRMAVAYYAANVLDRLVCGTTNRTELLLGYFTKHGDGGADIRPIAGLYKTEVRALARHVGVPADIVEKTPTAGLWAGQTDEAELGAPYGLIDVVLYGLVDQDLGIEGTAAELGVDESLVARYAHRLVSNRHKRTPVPQPPTDRPTPTDLFLELEHRT